MILSVHLMPGNARAAGNFLILPFLPIEQKITIRTLDNHTNPDFTLQAKGELDFQVPFLFDTAPSTG